VSTTKSREYLIAGFLIALLIFALALLVIFPSISSNPERNSARPVPSTLKALIAQMKANMQKPLMWHPRTSNSGKPAGILVMLGKKREAITLLA
jgi:hypothetical protein